jgi:sugar phosphate permease
MQEILKKTYGYRHVVLVMLWIIYIINYFDRIAVLTFLPLIREDLHLTHQEIGFAASIFFFAYALAQISSGFLADKFGPKKVMGIAAIVFTFVTFLTGLVQTFTQFILLRLGLGIGEGHHSTPSFRTISEWFPMKEKGRATAFFSTTWAVAPAIIPVIITQLAAVTGSWRHCFYLLGIPGIIALWILYKYVADRPEIMLAKGKLDKEEYDYIKAGLVELKEEDAHAQLGFRDLIRDPSLWLYTVQQFMTLAVFWGSTTWISSFLFEQHGFSLKAMGFMAAVPYVIAFFSTMIGGYLMDKVFNHKTKPVALLSYLLAVPILFYIGKIETGNTTLLIIMLILNGFFVNMVWGVINAYPQIRYPKHLVGRAVGFANGIGQLGAFLSPLIAGFLVTTSESGQILYDNVFIMFASCSVIGAIAVALLNENVFVENRKVSNPNGGEK